MGNEATDLSGGSSESESQLRGFTPGQWVASGNGVHVGIHCVATTHGELKHADARLIAAAPALYEAAQLLDRLNWIPGYALTTDNMLDIDKALEAARAALALVEVAA